MRNGTIGNPILLILEQLDVWLMPMCLTVIGKESWVRELKSFDLLDIRSHQTKGYHLIDETTSRVVIRRDVIFNESDFNKDGDASRSVNCFDDDVFLEVLQPSDELGQQDDPKSITSQWLVVCYMQLLQQDLIFLMQWELYQSSTPVLLKLTLLL